MANYTKTGPFVNNSAPGISSTFLNNLENVLAQPSGGTESGSYFLQGNGTVVGAVVSSWITTLSRVSTPVSVSIDTTRVAPTTGANTPAAPILYPGGFQVMFTLNSSSNTARCGGNYTVQF